MPTNPQDWTEPVDPAVKIRVRVRPGATESARERIRRIIADLTPAHVVLDVSLQ